MSPLDAFLHMCTTVSLGGFSSHDLSLGYFDSPLIEAVAVCFMLLSGINLLLYFTAWRAGSALVLWRNTEVRAYCVALVGSIALVCAYIVVDGTYAQLPEALRHSVFHVVSIATTTGYATVDYAGWPAFAPVLMLLLGCFVTCAGSTGGGIKMVRMMLLLKQSRRRAHPHRSPQRRQPGGAGRDGDTGPRDAERHRLHDDVRRHPGRLHDGADVQRTGAVHGLHCGGGLRQQHRSGPGRGGPGAQLRRADRLPDVGALRSHGVGAARAVESAGVVHAAVLAQVTPAAGGSDGRAAEPGNPAAILARQAILEFRTMNHRRHVLALGLIAAAGCSFAQTRPPADAVTGWPTRTVKILVGFPGGSTPDMAARVLADTMSKSFGQTVVVENRPGASGNLAADAVAKADDDHTLGIVINGNLTSSRLLNARLPFDPAKDFSLLSLIATAPLVLVTPTNQPSGAEFFDAARRAGDKWSYGSVGIGSVGHLGMEYVKSRAGNFEAVHVPYNGNPAVLNGLLGGQIHMALVPPGLALPQVRAGKLKAIGLTGGRSTLAPDVPPLADAGVRLNDLEVWVALVGPAALSTAAQDRLAREVPTLVRQAEARQKLFNSGWQVQGSSPEALRMRVKSETEILGGIIKARGIKAE
jgi:tripartite-type tricarboxylate transporter receptor subunit TctC